MTTFDPLDYDIYHIGISGGKDSSAALLWLIYESGWPLDRVTATFCDTGNEDYYTYAFTKMLSEKVCPIEVIKPEKDFWELAKFKRRFPSRKGRFCTQWLKVIPSREHILNLQRQGLNVLLLNGVRQEEGKDHNDRGNLPQFGWSESYAADVYRPVYFHTLDDIWAIHQKHLDIADILQMVRDDPDLDYASECWFKKYGIKVDFKAELSAWMESHGIPRNPLYDLGASRVGCFPCVNSAKMEIRAMYKYRPQRIDFIGQKELITGSEAHDGFSSFFARNVAPEAHRSKEVVTKTGETVKVCTVYDVAEWSQTARGGKQFDMEVMLDPYQSCGIGGECE